jgi:hypothetical protein
LPKELVMSRARLVAVAVATSLASVAAAPARAQKAPAPAPAAPPAPPAPAASAADIEEAKRHFQQGVALYNDGNFNGALAEFEAAYRVRSSPGVLYNIGLSQKALFRYAESVDTLERYLREETKLTGERRAEVTQLIAEMRALLADVTLTISPAEATVMVDGRSAGTAPLAGPLRIAAGNHVLEVHADGYRSQRRELMISAGVPVKLTFNLELIPKTGKVRINAKPPEAMVKIDSKVLGYPPAEAELAAGGHLLEVEAPKYLTHRSELVIAAGQTRTLDIALSKPPTKIVEKWYFWTPITVAVAGGLALGLGLGLRPEGPLVGTLGAGRVN